MLVLFLTTLLGASVAASDWPEVKLYSTFTAQLLAFQWDGIELKPAQDFRGTILVDSGRNKVMVHANLTAFPYGDSSVDVLLDFNEGFALTQMPTVGSCHLEHF